MESLVGTASRLNRGSAVQGMVVGGRGTIQSHNTLAFTVNSVAIEYRSKVLISIEDGDRVVVAGPKKKNGIVQAYAIKNLENGLMSSVDSTRMIVLGSALIVFGLALLFVVVGLGFLAYGIYAVKVGMDVREAVRTVSAVTPETTLP